MPSLVDLGYEVLVRNIVGRLRSGSTALNDIVALTQVSSAMRRMFEPVSTNAHAWNRYWAGLVSSHGFARIARWRDFGGTRRSWREIACALVYHARRCDMPFCQLVDLATCPCRDGQCRFNELDSACAIRRCPAHRAVRRGLSLANCDILSSSIAHLLVYQETDDFEATFEINDDSADLEEHFNAASRIATVSAATLLQICSHPSDGVYVGDGKSALTVHDVASAMRNVCVTSGRAC